MKTLNHYLIVNELKEDVKETQGGLLLAEKHREDTRYRKGTIESVGDEIGDIVKEGDMIWFDRVAGHQIEFANGDIRKVIKLVDVVIVE